MYIGDLLPDAPKLAARGNFKVGVKTIQVVNPNQIDILSSNEEKTILYDRPLTCLLYTSPSPRDRQKSRMPSSA